MTIGERIRLERKKTGLTQEEMGKIGGVTVKTQGSYERDERRPDADYLAAVSHLIDISFVISGAPSSVNERPAHYHVLSDDPSGEFELVSKYAVRASAGPGVAVESEDVVGSFAFRRDWLSKRGLSADKLALVNVVGDSMSPALEDGDTVLVDTGQTEPVSGATYVVRLGNDLLVKYIQRLPGDQLQLSSANPVYAPYTINMSAINGDVTVIGRVVAACRDW